MMIEVVLLISLGLMYRYSGTGIQRHIVGNAFYPTFTNVLLMSCFLRF